MAERESSVQQATSDHRRSERTTAGEPGWVGRCLNVVASILGFLTTGWLLAIVIEWIGMIWFWPEQGTQHARAMMEREIDFLSEDFKTSLFASSPAAFAQKVAESAYYWLFEWTHLIDLLQWLKATPVESQAQANLQQIYVLFEPFVLSAMMMTETFALRLSVLVLASPVFVLFAAVGFADGLMRRDLRRWGGGRESSLAHGASRATILPLIAIPWVIYLSWPMSIHPNLIILPAAMALGVAICVTAATFKKYL